MTAAQSLQALLSDLRDECQAIAQRRGIPAPQAHQITRAAYDAYINGANYQDAIDTADHLAEQLAGATA